MGELIVGLMDSVGEVVKLGLWILGKDSGVSIVEGTQCQEKIYCVLTPPMKLV